jgi:hypothetical protein
VRWIPAAFHGLGRSGRDKEEEARLLRRSGYFWVARHPASQARATDVKAQK